MTFLGLDFAAFVILGGAHLIYRAAR